MTIRSTKEVLMESVKAASINQIKSNQIVNADETK